MMSLLRRGSQSGGAAPLNSSSKEKSMLPTFVKIISSRKKFISLSEQRAKANKNVMMEEISLGSLIQGEVCLLEDSPYRILRAAESGKVDLFGRLYAEDPARLYLKDNRGRTATHQAAERNKTQILRFIFGHGGDINVRDQSGNTPLHVAVEYEALDAIGYLVEHGAETGLLNDKKQAPLHLATEMNKLAALSVIALHKSRFDAQLGGDHGRTALHLAAIHDHDECARILIKELGGCPRRPCRNGYYPIHEAAKNASSRTMEVFLEWGESRGCPREEMISFFDAEGNLPLHSAVHGGDIKAVELCLRSGAKISTQQQNLSTPVHLACAQGAMDIVRLMFSMQPMEKDQCLASCDAQKMTPIHCAAMFDHVEMVEFLVKEGANLNAVDKEKRSALLLAASHSAWRTVHSLLNLGADICLRDESQRNALHLIILNGGRLEEFANQSKTEACLRKLLNEKDSAGCSPLHYACRDGYIRSLENLIRLGACINLKNNKNESALHFAARFGRYNIAWQLLDSEKGTFIINESNGEGLTPLHIASQQGHTRVVQLLLNRGALLQRDHNGRNPLHLAAMSGYTQTMELLHSVHSHLLDQVDKDGNSALHLATIENKQNSISLLLCMGCKLIYNSKGLSAIDYAIYYKFPEAALALVTHDQRGAEILALRSEKNPCIILSLIASMPRVFEAVLDKAITKANCKKDSKEFYCVQMDPLANERTEARFNVSKFLPLPALNAMVVHGRVELLSHTLSQKYLQVKWNSYGKHFHLAYLFLYIIFLLLVTSFIANLLKNYTNNDNQENNILNNSLIKGNQQPEFTKGENYEQKTPMMYCSAIAIILYVAVNTIREGLQAYQLRWQYMLDPFNIVSWILYISALTMVSPVFKANLGDHQFPCAAITVFLSWFTLLSYLQRFDPVGIYVVMFLEVLQTLIKVLLVFSILIIAFGLSFYILLLKGNHLSFSNVPMSLMRTFSMMLGDINFLGTFVNPFYEDGQSKTSRTLPYPMPTFIILGIFMVFMPILIMNLLIGLAVGDIESVRRNAQLKRLAMQVVQHTRLERKLPKMFLERVNHLELIEYPNVLNGKRGFLESVVKKWFCNQFPESCPETTFDTNDDILTERLEKQKRQLNEISLLLDRQHQLIRLIVQKMEIKTEADDVDEGVSPSDVASSTSSSRWTSPRVRSKLRAALSLVKTRSS